MLAAIGVSSIEELFDVPAELRLEQPLALPAGESESEVFDRLAGLARRNADADSEACFIGAGMYDHYAPALIDAIVSRSEFLTPYTPYQPEISQGGLQAMFEFQTAMTELTGLPLSSAGLYEGPSTVAAAGYLAIGATRRRRFVVSGGLDPQSRETLATYAAGYPAEIDEVPLADGRTDLEALGSAVGDDTAAVFVQYPNYLGAVEDLEPIATIAHDAGALLVAACDPIALGILRTPGDFGVDIAVGEGQPLGNRLDYGGPSFGFFCATDAQIRRMPGRIAGETTDVDCRRGFVLALQTREQHIRREKATSNICTAQVLLAVIASMYAVYHGPEGLTHIARTVHRRAVVLATGLAKLGFAPTSQAFFDTVTVQAGGKQNEIVTRALAERINLRIGDGTLGIAVDETTTPAIVEAVWRAFGGKLSYADVEVSARETLHLGLKRDSAFLIHPVFHTHRSETELLRYMRKLSDRDLALDRAMIPLGSCTMKLNATTEMIPLTWPEFGSLHPFAPAEQARGYHAMFKRLEQWLCDITGYDAVSLQPNSGAQGEYAGLLAIRAYHTARGEPHRKVCLIPSSAHGTNPASAHMVGMEVVVTACDIRGDVDVDDLRAKAEKHSKNLAAVMITYPSTHGVFEEHIRDICDIVHSHGGQVYLDGANMNAQVGLSRPGDYGADVSHLNLHKTFCIPHGGGGPGMGPIGVKAHLEPFLPGHPARDGSVPVGPVSAAPFGSASILTISYIYILMMSGEGLTRATEIAILNANYIANRLDPHFPVLYRNAKGRVAHECIVDPRALKTTSGVTVDDIAKRLIDYGFHAPTMSFPVPGTLMIEPTESESKAEIDRFCDAMIAIRQEIAEIESGRWKVEASPLRHAPHTVHDIADDAWSRAYSRAEGCFPAGTSRTDKYWCPVGRVDNVYGDRNLVCSCPPVADYAQAAE